MNDSIRSAPTKSPKRFLLQHPYDMKQQSMTMQPMQNQNTAKKVGYPAQNITNASMDRSMIQQLEELDFYRHRCHELENHVQSLQGDFEMVHQRSRDNIQVDNKLDIYVQENQTLHLDNEKLAKFAQQRKTEAELWKQKYDNQLSQVIQIKANYELEIRQLSVEVQRLVGRVEEFEFDKQRQIIDASSKIDDHSAKSIDGLKRQFNQQSELQDQQVRKLREQVEEQNLEVDSLQAKLLRLKNDDDEEMKRLIKDNEVLRSRLNQIEIERQEEIEDLAQNLSEFQKQQLISLKQAHSSQNNVIETEVGKLRGLIEVKNVEIETLLQQNQRNKMALKEESDYLRSELTLLKQKLLEQERQGRNQQELLQEQLTVYHEDNLLSLRRNYENQLVTLEKEISDLKRNQDRKGQEIQILLEEKSQLRDFLENQISDLKRELEDEKIHKFELEREKNYEIDEIQEQFSRAQSQASEHSDQNVDQINFLEGELSRLKELIIIKQRDFESHLNQSSLQKKQQDDDLRRAKQEAARQKDICSQIEQSKNNEIEDLQSRNSKLDSLYRDKSRNADTTSEHQTVEVRRLKEQLDIKSQEIDSLLVQRSGFERECRRIRDENEEFKTRQIQAERERIASQEELKSKLQGSSLYEVNQLKSAFNTQMRVLQDENNTLGQSLENRDKDIHELLQKYDQMARSFDQGGPIGPESVTNKRICEVLLKSKSQRTSIQRNH